MPELPEVETIRRGLALRVSGRQIVRAELRRPDLRRPFPPMLSNRLEGARIGALSRRGKPYDKPHLMADLPEVRDRYMEGLKIQQMDHMEKSLEYCRKSLDLGLRWRG